MHNTMHFSTLDGGSPMSDIMDLIARCAPRFMKAGGGSLQTEKAPWNSNRRQRAKLSGPERYRIRSLRRDGHTYEQIAAEIGRSISVVERACKVSATATNTQS